jgi:hypothetical protein
VALDQPPAAIDVLTDVLDEARFDEFFSLRTKTPAKIENVRER